ncbi:hypothetical protein B5S31_g330 [[Candida] boidinii]|nr:hypothetical protein B5S31_g330 [[Candida] boidinii]GME96166.1 unnamed protein product [[Candida] boidinii]
MLKSRERGTADRQEGAATIAAASAASAANADAAAAANAANAANAGDNTVAECCHHISTHLLFPSTLGFTYLTRNTTSSQYFPALVNFHNLYTWQ